MDTKLLEYATEKQAKKLKALWEHGSERKAAEALGMARSNIHAAVKAVKARAAQHGYSPDHDMVHPVPEPFTIKRISTNYDKTGAIGGSGQWVVQEQDEVKRQAAAKAAIEAMSEEIPRLAPIAPPRVYMKELCNQYTLTDFHVGMLAWSKEGGADWDLKIAEKTAIEVFNHIISNSPKAQTCVVNQLGDFLHFDGLTPVTPTSGHILDADGRFSKVVAVAIRILRRIVDMALHAHKAVHVIIAEGNHDMASSVWLRQMFKILYENEPRVTINDSELPYYAFQHGNNMLFYSHGHVKKLADFPGVAAAQFPKMWGDTTFRYGHGGHYHSEETFEKNGMHVTQHRTLAAKDSYSARLAYFAERKMSSLTYHSAFGYAGATLASPEMVMAA